MAPLFLIESGPAGKKRDSRNRRMLRADEFLRCLRDLSTRLSIVESLRMLERL